MIHNTKSILALSCILIFLAGCIPAFREGNLPAIENWPPPVLSHKKSISILYTAELLVNGEETEVTTKQLKELAELIFQAYEDAGLFSSVSSLGTNSDLRAEVKIIQKQEFSTASLVLTILTVGIIPSMPTDEYIVQTTIKDKEGTILGSFEKSEVTKTWFGLIGLPFVPTNWFLTVYDETIYDLNRAVIQEARQKDLFIFSGSKEFSSLVEKSKDSFRQ